MILIISGIDSSHRSGMHADERVFNSLSLNYLSLVTGYYDQNSIDNRFVPTDFEEFRKKLEKYLEDYEITAIKIGALFSDNQIKLLSKKLRHLTCPIIVDPVLSPSAGGSFNESLNRNSIYLELFQIATLVTPNTVELNILFGRSADEISPLCLKKLRIDSLLIKGGHTASKTDLLIFSDYKVFFSSKVFKSELRGTGCFLSSLITAYHDLEKGTGLQEIATKSMWHFKYCYEQSVRFNESYIKPYSTNKMEFYDSFPNAYYEGFENSYVSSPKLPKLNNPIYPIAENRKIFETLNNESPGLLQLRLKNISLSKVRQEIDLLEKTPKKCLWILNDFDRLIEGSNFDGIHIGQEDLIVSDIDLIKSKNKILGISTHSYFELAIALHLKPTYIALGPIFKTTCKSMKYQTQGYKKIVEWKNIARNTPIVSIGGLNSEKAKECIKFGSGLVSFQSHITHRSNPGKSLKTLINFVGTI